MDKAKRARIAETPKHCVKKTLKGVMLYER